MELEHCDSAEARKDRKTKMAIRRAADAKERAEWKPSKEGAAAWEAFEKYCESKKAQTDWDARVDADKKKLIRKVIQEHKERAKIRQEGKKLPPKIMGIDAFHDQIFKRV